MPKVTFRLTIDSHVAHAFMLRFQVVLDRIEDYLVMGEQNALLTFLRVEVGVEVVDDSIYFGLTAELVRLNNLLFLVVAEDFCVQALLHFRHQTIRIKGASLFELLVAFAYGPFEALSLLVVVEIAAKSMRNLTYYLAVGGDDYFLAYLRWKLVQYVLLQAADHKLVLQDIVELLCVGRTRIVSSVGTFLRVTEAVDILEEVVENVRSQHL